MKNIVLISLFAIIFTGCAATDQTKGSTPEVPASDTYHFTPWNKDYNFPSEAYLQSNEVPIVIPTPDLIAEFRNITSRWYWCIGQVTFNNSETSNVTSQEKMTNICKRHKAKIAIWTQSLADIDSGTFTLPHRNYHSFYAHGEYHSFATTSYTTYSYEYNIYVYSGYLFIRIPKKYRMQYAPGFSVTDLTPQNREKYRQNSGSLITVVYEKTNAFYANLFPGDIITQINDKAIRTTKDLIDVKNSSQKGDIWVITFVRNGQLYRVTLEYGLYPSKQG